MCRSYGAIKIDKGDSVLFRGNLYSLYCMIFEAYSGITNGFRIIN